MSQNDKALQAIDWIDDFIARCNGDDRGACESVNTVRDALQSPMSSGGLQDVLLEVYEALYGSSNVFTPSRVTAQRYMADPDGEWLCIRYGDAEALRRAWDALTLLEKVGFELRQEAA